MVASPAGRPLRLSPEQPDQKPQLARDGERVDLYGKRVLLLFPPRGPLLFSRTAGGNGRSRPERSAGGSASSEPAHRFPCRRDRLHRGRQSCRQGVSDVNRTPAHQIPDTPQLGAVVVDDQPRLATPLDQRGQLAGDLSSGDQGVRDRRLTFLWDVIGDVEDAEPPPRSQLIMDEI